MDLALYNKIYKDRVDKEVILRYTEYLKPCYLYCLTEDYVWGVKSKVESREKTPIIKIN